MIGMGMDDGVTKHFLVSDNKIMEIDFQINHFYVLKNGQKERKKINIKPIWYSWIHSRSHMYVYNNKCGFIEFKLKFIAIELHQHLKFIEEEGR